MSVMPFLPSLIMFAITVVVVTLCYLPTLIKISPPLANFYWVGTWFFIGLIAVIAGGEQTAILAGYDSPNFAMRLKTSATLCFVIFVTFGWFRLTGAALVAGVKRVIA